MEWKIEQIREKLTTDDRWAVRVLIAIYNKQTDSEKAAKETTDHNGMGFNGADAEILTSIAEFYLKREFITEKQMAVVRRRIKKYAGQLTKIANGVL